MCPIPPPLHRRDSPQNSLFCQFSESNVLLTAISEIKRVSSIKAKGSALKRSITNQRISGEPGDFDVVCGRGKGSYNRPGNRFFQQLCREQMQTYLHASSKTEKSIVLLKIVKTVKSIYNGRFLKYDSRQKCWYEISDSLARSKVGHAMREVMTNKVDNGSSISTDTNDMDFFTKHQRLLACQRQCFEELLKAEGLELMSCK